MNLNRSQDRIIELINMFILRVEGATVMNKTDVNRVSEIVLVPLLAEVLNLPGLVNLNEVERTNFPGIDLADPIARVAVQVTSSADNEKIKDTLRTFVKYEYFKKYDRLIFYILTKKQKSYTGSGHDEIIQRAFQFNKDADIIDGQSLLAKIKNFPIAKTLRIENILEANFGDADVASRILESSLRETEDVFLNMLPLKLPDTLFVADLTIDRDSVLLTSRGDGGSWLKNSATSREVALEAMRQAGLKFATDWECHENKLVTFHNLYEDRVPLKQIVDSGTITPIPTSRYYEAGDIQNVDRENVLKSLLRRCLKQKLFKLNVSWQHQANLFIFVELDGESIRYEQWFGERENERKVFERTMNRDHPEKILICKHFGFRVHFKSFNGQWFLIVNPDWFFSWDGYRKSQFGDEKIKWLKREEDNKQVFNHFRFLNYFLTHEKPSALFGPEPSYKFLSIGSIPKFNSAPFLNDLEWNPPRARAELSSAEEDSQGQLDFSL
ncbi:MAG: SMEK domain-containing protein [Pyrinomonadaceae bacterium]